jgi:ubiquinone biosynthesis protein UbiJ
MSKPNYPAPRKALMGKVAALPELVLSVALDGQANAYRVAVVKNRHGKADPTAEAYISLSAEASHMTLYNSPAELQRARTMRQWQ